MYGIEGQGEICTQSAEMRLAVSGAQPVYFGITYVWFIPSRLPVFAVEPQYRHQDFLSKVSFDVHIQNIKKNHVGLKFESCL